MTEFAEQSPLFDLDEATPVPLPSGRTPSYMADHRKRLRARFMAGGPTAMPDYELLELVPFSRHPPPRCQTPRPRADGKIRRFQPRHHGARTPLA